MTAICIQLSFDTHTLYSEIWSRIFPCKRNTFSIDIRFFFWFFSSIDKWNFVVYAVSLFYCYGVGLFRGKNAFFGKKKNYKKIVHQKNLFQLKKMVIFLSQPIFGSSLSPSNLLFIVCHRRTIFTNIRMLSLGITTTIANIIWHNKRNRKRNQLKSMCSEFGSDASIERRARKIQRANYALK